jgi:hypothetical protein
MIATAPALFTELLLHFVCTLQVLKGSGRQKAISLFEINKYTNCGYKEEFTGNYCILFKFSELKTLIYRF